MKNIEIIRSIMKNNFYPGLDILIEIKSNWDLILVNDISKYCFPFKVFLQKDKIDLYINSLPHALLDLRNLNIKHNINLYFAKDFINKIFIIPSIS